ncbi:MAG: DUF1929 domain-containing protein [Deltaproteobacteria bacterium]|nr:DUF1929 domain-containing protein [Deltaproteobacteria bacterium]
MSACCRTGRSSWSEAVRAAAATSTGTTTCVYTPNSGGGTWSSSSLPKPYPAAKDPFCAGHTIDWNGDFVIHGGLLGYGAQNGFGIANSAKYSAAYNAWTTLTTTHAYYCPTLIPANGGFDVWSFAGAAHGGQIARLPWLGTSWATLPVSHQTVATYPRVHPTTDGQLFVSSPDAGNFKNYKIATSGAFTRTLVGNDLVPNEGTPPIYHHFKGSSTLAVVSQAAPKSVIALTGGVTPYYKDLSAATPAWTPLGTRPAETGADGVQFPVRRYYQSATLLPTGQTLITGGRTGEYSGAFVRNAELGGQEINGVVWPAWSVLSPATLQRGYHSTALLLPDGRVWTAGSHIPEDGPDCSNWNFDQICDLSPDTRVMGVEIFTPWYYSASRPTITNCSSIHFTYSGSPIRYIGVGNTTPANVARVIAMRPGSVTHNHDMNQLAIELTFTTAAGGVNVAAPSSYGLMPAGDWMLFVLRKKTGTEPTAVPSIACWTRRNYPT